MDMERLSSRSRRLGRKNETCVQVDCEGIKCRGSTLGSSGGTSSRYFCVTVPWVNGFVEQDIWDCYGKPGIKPVRKPGLAVCEWGVQAVEWGTCWVTGATCCERASVPVVWPWECGCQRVSWMVRLGTFLYKMVLDFYAHVSLPVHLHRFKCQVELLLDWGLFCKCLLERFFWWLVCI